MKWIIFFIKAVLIASILLSSYCNADSKSIPDPQNYASFVRFHIDFFCKKSIECNQPLIRTISVSERDKVTVENCKEEALTNFERKLELHTNEMKSVSVICYKALREASCKKMLLVQFTHPACLRLRESSNRAYEKAGLLKPTP